MDGADTMETAGRTRPGGPWSRLSRSHVRTALAAILGAAIGGAYSHFIGCKAGTCAITSNVWVSSLYGALVGGVLGWPGRDR